MNRNKIALGIVAFGMLLGSFIIPEAGQDRPKFSRQSRKQVSEARLMEEVRHQLVMLSWYGVFDNLEYSVRGDTVILSGQVTRPTLKSDAEAQVKKLEEVGKVINNIEVLPLSPNDDRIRIAVYRAIFGSAGLDRYAMLAVPPIHIVVRNGHVTLTGVVSRNADKYEAEIRAKGVSGVFSVTNQLRVEQGE